MENNTTFIGKILGYCILFVPNKKLRRQLRNRYARKVSDSQFDDIFQNYEKDLTRIKAKYGKEKIKVGFLVSENQKWNCQSIYEEMAASFDFEPIVLITKVYSDKHDDFGKYYTTVEANYNYFKTRGMNVEYAYDIDTKSYMDLKNFGLDIIFYQQPWAIAPSQDMPVTSEYALACYVPYGVPMVSSFTDYDLDFYRTLWHQYCVSDIVSNHYNKCNTSPLNNYKIVGHPKFDEYLNGDCSPEGEYIIYAPHHSFAPSHFNFATFKWNGKYILEYAKSHPELKFVFKPHPQFKTRAIIRKIMTEPEIEEYFEEWKKIALFCDDADYYGLFKKSRLLITDCSSFLGEYFPTQKPVINLKNKNSIEFNPLGKFITDRYYKVYDLNTLKSTMKMLLEDDIDPKKDERIEGIKELNVLSSRSSTRILKCIRDELV